MIGRVASSRNGQLLVATIGGVCLSFLAGMGIARGKVGTGAILAGLGVVGATLALLVTPAHKTKTVLLGGTLFLLCVYPAARVVVRGNMPIYFIDILIGAALLFTLFGNRAKQEWSSSMPLPFLVALFWLPSSLLSFVHEVLITGIFLEPLYMLIRTLLSISLFFVIPSLVRSRRALDIVLWCLVIGVTISATLGFLQSLPIPNNPVRPILDDLSTYNLERKYARYEAAGRPVRAISLMGTSNITGAAIIITLPLTLGMYNAERFRRRWIALWWMLIFQGLGIAATYSRSTFLGTILVLWMLVHRGIRGRQRGLASAGLLLLILLILGNSTGLFRFEFLADKFASLQDPSLGYTETNQARLIAYRDAAFFLLSHPLWIIAGRGFAYNDLLGRGLVSSLAVRQILNTPEHSLLVATFYHRGLLAMIVLVFIWLTSFRLVRGQQSQAHGVVHESSEYGWLAYAIQTSLIGLLPFWAFDHFFGTSIHSQALLFAFLSLVVVVRRLEPAGRTNLAIPMEI